MLHLSKQLHHLMQLIQKYDFLVKQKISGSKCPWPGIKSVFNTLLKKYIYRKAPSQRPPPSKIPTSNLKGASSK